MKLIKTMLVGMVSLALLVGQGQGPPKNHWEGNCGALMSGQSEYWLDSDGDGQPEDGPYAVWNEDADGNPVNCGGGPEWLPFNEVDTDGNGTISRDEARAKYGTDPMGNPVQDFDQRFDEVDANGSGDVDPAEHAAAQNDQGGDCGFKMGDNGSVMVSLPDGSERWLMPGEYTMNDDGSLTVNKDGEPDNGATITPPPCNDGGGSNN